MLWFICLEHGYLLVKDINDGLQPRMGTFNNNRNIVLFFTVPYHFLIIE